MFIDTPSPPQSNPILQNYSVSWPFGQLLSDNVDLTAMPLVLFFFFFFFYLFIYLFFLRLITPWYFRVAPPLGALAKYNFFLVGRDYTMVKVSYAKVSTLKKKTLH